MVLWLSAMLGLVSPLLQTVHSRQFYNFSSSYDWKYVACSPWRIKKITMRECTAYLLNKLLSNQSTPLARRDKQGWNHLSVIQTVGKGWQGWEIARHLWSLPPRSLRLLSSFGRGSVSCMVSLGWLREWGRVGLKGVKPLTYGISENLIIPQYICLV